MKIQIIEPNEKISAYVDKVMIIQRYHLSSTFTLPLFAYGIPFLIFKTISGKIGKNTTNNLTLFGQTVLPETLVLEDDFTLITYYFKPFSIFTLFGISAQELTDNPIDLNLLAPSLTKELQERLLNSETIESMISLLDHYIYSLVLKSKADNQLIKYATKIISSNPSRESLVQTQKELYITERTFQRMFEKNIGISPNLYRRICQFYSAFEQLNKTKNIKLSDIAFDNGYADQSHFTRAFKEFTKLTPKEYISRWLPGRNCNLSVLFYFALITGSNFVL